MLDFFADERRVRWLMPAAPNLHRCVSKRASEWMQAFQGGLVQLQDDAGPKLEGTLRIFDEGSDYLDREIELANAIFGFTSRDLIGIGKYERRISNAVAITGHALFHL